MTDETRKFSGLMRSEAPWPVELEDLVGRARCHKGWSFALEDNLHDNDEVRGLRLAITVRAVDAYHQERPRATVFLFPVPAATFDRATWQRWLWDRVMDVPRHETGEAFGFVYQGPMDARENEVTFVERPFAPFHGPGRDPHRNVEIGVDPMEVRVTQDGGRYPGLWWDGTVIHDDEAHEECEYNGSGHRCTPVQLVEED